MSAPPGSKADALRKLKQRRASQEPHGGLPANHAARSHELNDQYMDNFDKAWQELYGEHAGDGPGRHQVDGKQDARMTVAAVGAAATAGGSEAERLEKIAPGFRRGPIDEKGVRCDLSDRPCTCSSADWATGEAVVGCSDHALYVVDLETGRRKRTLHTKQHGHAEWVTAVVHAAAGRIVSAGMDSKLCVWNAGSTRCTDLRAHSGSVSCLGVLPGSGLVASAGYDKTARLWDVAGARPRQACCLEGHAAPVTSLACCQALLVTGDRSGNLVAWDAAAAALAWQAKKAHNGHVTALTHSSPATGQAALVMSGGQDGVVRGWDARQGSCAFKREVHQNARGRGAVGDIIASGAPAADLLLTAGADATVRVLDPASGFRELHCIALPDFPYSLSAAGGLVFAGCGDGTVVVADVRSGAALYALGANQAAVRCLNVGADRLFTAGDDGTALLYSFL